MAICKHMIRLVTDSVVCSVKYGVSGAREMSKLVQSNDKHAFFVDSLRLVRRLEGQGVPSEQAEAITEFLKNVSQSFVSKTDMQKSEMLQKSNLFEFKSQLKSSQEHHFSMLQREMEKLRNEIERMRNKLRYEINMVTDSQRLDLNLERRRIRREFANHYAETNILTNKLDKEIHALRSQLEINYRIATLVSISAVGLAVILM